MLRSSLIPPHYLYAQPIPWDAMKTNKQTIWMLQRNAGHLWRSDMLQGPLGSAVLRAAMVCHPSERQVRIPGRGHCSAPHSAAVMMEGAPHAVQCNDCWCHCHPPPVTAAPLFPECRVWHKGSDCPVSPPRVPRGYWLSCIPGVKTGTQSREFVPCISSYHMEKIQVYRKPNHFCNECEM